MSLTLDKILILSPVYRDYVWGGNRLRPSGERTAEAWVVYEDNLVRTGVHAGKTLGQLSLEYGENLLGLIPVQSGAKRFPLLIKLLDCADWLSLQVHPNDEQAKLLEGPGQLGKTEAWHIIEANDHAQLVAGMLPGMTKSTLETAILNQKIVEFVQYHRVHAGDSIFMPPGTIHALGPGLLLYEVQQSSDITYRVFDWNRPETATRRLHLEKSLSVVDPQSTVNILPLPTASDSGVTRLIACPYFTLEHIHGDSQPLQLSTREASFHALTVIAGKVRIQAGEETVELERFASALIPANCGQYSIQPIGESSLLKSSVEPFSE